MGYEGILYSLIGSSLGIILGSLASIKYLKWKVDDMEKDYKERVNELKSQINTLDNTQKGTRELLENINKDTSMIKRYITNMDKNAKWAFNGKDD